MENNELNDDSFEEFEENEKKKTKIPLRKAIIISIDIIDVFKYLNNFILWVFIVWNELTANYIFLRDRWSYLGVEPGSRGSGTTVEALPSRVAT